MYVKGDLFKVIRFYVLDILVGVEYFVSGDMRELIVLDTEKFSFFRVGFIGSY